MSYKILSKTQADDTIITNVEFTIGDHVFEANVSHFRPNSLSDIISGIENREASEQARLEAISTAQSILDQIVVS